MEYKERYERLKDNPYISQRDVREADKQYGLSNSKDRASTPKDSEPPTFNNASGSLHDIELMFLPFFNGEIQSEELIAELEAYIEQEKQKARVEELERLKNNGGNLWSKAYVEQVLDHRLAELRGGTGE